MKYNEIRWLQLLKKNVTLQFLVFFENTYGWKGVWKICVILFKNWKYVIELAYQTGFNMLPFEFELKVIMCTLFKTVVSENLPNTFLQTGFVFTFCHLFVKFFFFFMPLKFDILQRLKTKMRLHLRLKSFRQKIFTVQVTN